MASFASNCVQKCAKVRSHIARPKKGRTHIARTYQEPFRTHIAHVRVCAHVCVCEFNFATHSLIFVVARVESGLELSQLNSSPQV